jgi:hypothetical protein
MMMMMMMMMVVLLVCQDPAWGEKFTFQIHDRASVGHVDIAVRHTARRQKPVPHTRIWGFILAGAAMSTSR